MVSLDPVDHWTMSLREASNARSISSWVISDSCLPIVASSCKTMDWNERVLQVDPDSEGVVALTRHIYFHNSRSLTFCSKSLIFSKVAFLNKVLRSIDLYTMKVLP